MSKPAAQMAQKLAQALMLEQVAFYKLQLMQSDPDKNNHHFFIHQCIDRIYQSSEHILLQDAIKLDQLQAVVKKYSFELNLGGELLEFIGVASRNVYASILSNDTPLRQFISDESFELWLYKILELKPVRYDLRDLLIHNDHIHQISLQLANHILEQHTPWLDHLRTLKLKSNSFSTRALSFLQDQQQNIELKLEQRLAQALLKHLGEIVVLPTDELANICLHLWSNLKEKTLKECFSQFEEIDFEDFFIVVYETWKQLRQTPVMQDMILNVVGAFYQYFAEFDLKSLLHAVGLNKDDLSAEAIRFIPHLVQALEQLDLLDAILLTLLQPFYLNAQTQQLIQSHMQSSSPDID